MKLKLIRTLIWGRRGEEGNALVEMALVSLFLFLPMIFGIFEVSFALYSLNFVTNAARQAARYSAVRGAESCIIASSFPNCNLSPSGGTNPTTASGSAALLAYVQNSGYPGINMSNVSVTATWLSADVSNPGNGNFSTTAWDSTCTTTDLNGQPCNTVGNAVQVKVTYPFGLNMPFWKQVIIPISSTSQMVINE